jgi:hypothetical protein
LYFSPTVRFCTSHQLVYLGEDALNKLAYNETIDWTILSSICEDLQALPDLKNHALFVAAKKSFQKLEVTSSTFAKDFGKLCKSEKFSDIKIVVQQTSFFGHKCILTTHSEFFQKMLASEMKEGTASVIEIKELDAGVFGIVLEYMVHLVWD